QAQHSRARDDAAQQSFQDAVIDAGEVFGNIGLEGVGLAMGLLDLADKALGAIGTGVGALADAAGVGVVDKGLVDQGLDDIVNGPLGDPVVIGGRVYQAALWLEHVELAAGA